MKSKTPANSRVFVKMLKTRSRVRERGSATLSVYIPVQRCNRWFRLSDRLIWLFRHLFTNRLQTSMATGNLDSGYKLC